LSALLVVSPRIARRHKRDSVDETAKQIVLDAYREGCLARSPKPFDEALKGYLRRYPHVKKELAGHAVAHILATAGM
jgi:hypothetical protein